MPIFQQEEFVLQSQADGFVSQALLIRVPGAKGRVFIVHGMAEYKERYLPLAQFLGEQGFETVLFDLRGHGQSKVEGKLGYFAATEGWQKQRADIATLLRQQRSPDGQNILFGHSMGSLFARALLKQEQLNLTKVVLSGCPAWNPQILLAKRLAQLASIWRPQHEGKLIGRLVFGAYAKQIPNRQTDFDWLSFAADNVQDYVASPLCGFAFTNRGFYDLFQLVENVYRAQPAEGIQNSIPILMQSGAEDLCGDPLHRGVERAAESLRHFGFTDVRLQLYPKSRHEVYLDREKAAVWADLAAFLAT